MSSYKDKGKWVPGKRSTHDPNLEGTAEVEQNVALSKQNKGWKSQPVNVRRINLPLNKSTIQYRDNNQKDISRNTSSLTSIRDTESPSMKNRSRIDGIRELQAKNPNIRLPSNLLNLDNTATGSTPKEKTPEVDLPTGRFFSCYYACCY